MLSRKGFVCCAVAVMSWVFLSAAAMCADEAEKAPAEAGTGSSAKESKGPAEVKVSVNVISLGKFDVGTGSFTVDFYLDLYHPEGFEPKFEFVNGRGSIELMKNEPTEKFYRIQANLVSPVDLKRFPFDNQVMQIVIEDKEATIEKTVYVPLKEESALDPGVSFIGWQLDGWDARVETHEYKVWNENYSRYVFEVYISRIKANSFLKTFLPVLILMLILVSSFILNPDQITTRLATVSGTLVAAVMMHIGMSNQIPPVGYLTFADKFMIVTFSILFVSFVLSITIFVLQSRGKKEQAQRFSKWCEKLVFIGVPVLYVALFLFVH